MARCAVLARGSSNYGRITPGCPLASRSAGRRKRAGDRGGRSDWRKIRRVAQAALTTPRLFRIDPAGDAPCGAPAAGETMAGRVGYGRYDLTAPARIAQSALGIALGRGEAPPGKNCREGEFTAGSMKLAALRRMSIRPVSNCFCRGRSCAARVTIDEAIEKPLDAPRSRRRR